MSDRESSLSPAPEDRGIGPGTPSSSPTRWSTRSDSPLTPLSSPSASPPPVRRRARAQKRKDGIIQSQARRRRKMEAIDEFDRAKLTDDEGDLPGEVGLPERARKQFLKSGMYSHQFKADDTHGVRSGATGRSARPNSHDDSQDEERSVFPMPMHWGEVLLTRKADFLLPEYLLNESESIVAKMEAKAKPEPFKEIKRNIWVCRPRLLGAVAICMCSPGSGCGDNCINRLMQYICDPKFCPCGMECTNQRLGSRGVPECEVVKCGKRGFGLRAKEPIKTGQLIDEYRGEIVNLSEATRRTEQFYKETGNFYLLDYDAAAGEVIDGGMKGNRTRFANHSCDPNCHMQKWTLCGNGQQLTAEFEVGLFASRDIAAGEELCYDYGWSMFVTRAMDGKVTHQGTPIHCHCGSENCSGVLGGKKVAKPKEPAQLKKKKRKVRKPKERSNAGSARDEGLELSEVQETTDGGKALDDVLGKETLELIGSAKHALALGDASIKKTLPAELIKETVKRTAARTGLGRRPLRSTPAPVPSEDPSSSRATSVSSLNTETGLQRESSMTAYTPEPSSEGTAAIFGADHGERKAVKGMSQGKRKRQGSPPQSSQLPKRPRRSGVIG